MPDQHLSDIEWTRIAWYLSLDFIGPLLNDTGLCVADPAMFRDSFRGLIMHLAETDAEQVPLQGLASYSLAYLRARMNAAGYGALTRWLSSNYYYVHADRPQLSAWQTAFGYFRKSWRKNLLDNCPQGNEILSAYQKQVTDECLRIKDLYKQQAKQPLPFWDIEIMAMAGLCFDPEDDALLDFVLQSVESDRLLQLSESSGQWLPVSLLGLQKTGQALIDKYEIWMPEPLIAFENLYTL